MSINRVSSLVFMCAKKRKNDFSSFVTIGV